MALRVGVLRRRQRCGRRASGLRAHAGAWVRGGRVARSQRSAWVGLGGALRRVDGDRFRESTSTRRQAGDRPVDSRNQPVLVPSVPRGKVWAALRVGWVVSDSGNRPAPDGRPEITRSIPGISRSSFPALCVGRSGWRSASGGWCPIPGIDQHQTTGRRSPGRFPESAGPRSQRSAWEGLGGAPRRVGGVRFRESTSTRRQAGDHPVDSRNQPVLVPSALRGKVRVALCVGWVVSDSGNRPAPDDRPEIARSIPGISRSSFPAFRVGRSGWMCSRRIDENSALPN